MIVLDASAAIEWLLQTSTGQRVEQQIFSQSELLMLLTSSSESPCAKRLPLATLDENLRRAATRVGVTLVACRRSPNQRT